MKNSSRYLQAVHHLNQLQVEAACRHHPAPAVPVAAE
jgi:hypothetical protein